MDDDVRRAARARGERILRVGFIVKLVLGVGKTLGGFAAGSGSLIADGWNNLSDLLTNAVAWVSFRLADQPPDEDHHYGHGNFEAAAGALLGAVLLAVAVGILWQAFAFESTVEPNLYGVLALGLAALSGAVHEVLARVTGRVGRELSSHSLVALGRDNRADALSSLLVMLAVGSAFLGWRWAEPAATVAIGAWIGWMGLRSFREGFDVLTDRVPEPELRSGIEGVAASTAGVEGVQEVRIHPLGSHYRVDMQVSVDGGLSVRQGHDIAHAVARAVTAWDPRLQEVHVHVNPH